jgi:hypothetical protein
VGPNWYLDPLKLGTQLVIDPRDFGTQLVLKNRFRDRISFLPVDQQLEGNKEFNVTLYNGLGFCDEARLTLTPPSLSRPGESEQRPISQRASHLDTNHVRRCFSDPLGTGAFNLLSPCR